MSDKVLKCAKCGKVHDNIEKQAEVFEAALKEQEKPRYAIHAAMFQLPVIKPPEVCRLQCKACGGTVFYEQAVKEYNFGDALQKLRKGHTLQRKGWNGKNMTVKLMRGGVGVQDYFVMKNAQGIKVMGWRPSSADILALDWVIINE